MFETAELWRAHNDDDEDEDDDHEDDVCICLCTIDACISVQYSSFVLCKWSADCMDSL